MKTRNSLLLLSAFIILSTSLPLRATRVIANWDMVPFQVFDSSINVGVVAFHETGVDVEFKVNGTLVQRATDPTCNSAVNVYEYWVTLHAADYADGPISVTATAFPDGSGHTARTLDTLRLYANSHGTLTNSNIAWVDCDNGSDATGTGVQTGPYQTIEKGYKLVGAGGTVYLKASKNYKLSTKLASKNYRYWTTIMAAPGLAAGDVVIAGYTEDGTSTGRFGENMVHWKNVSVYGDNAPGYGTIFYFESGNDIWFDGVTLYDKRGQYNGSNPFGGNSPYRTYLTDCTVRDLMNVQTYPFLRNATIKRIGSDIYRPANNLTAINIDIDSVGFKSDSTGAHPDFVQFYNPGDTVDNVIVYNNKAVNMSTQGLFGADCRNFAVVNLLFEKDPDTSYAISQMSGVWDHVLLWHTTFVDGGIILIDDPVTAKSNYSALDNIFNTFGCDSVKTLPNSTIAYNHFDTLFWNQPVPMGTNFTKGNPEFVDTSDADDDYRIKTTSPCYQSGTPIPGVPADLNGNLWDPVHPDRGCYSTYQSGVKSGPKGSQMLKGPSMMIRRNSLLYGGHIELLANLDRSQPVKILIHDCQGRLVRTLYSGWMGQGQHEIIWDGKNANGMPVSGRIFFAAMILQKGMVNAPVAVIR
ncbi:MAG TPA: FlgD immunoglobulin-like domain containing protein [Chitinivibrionales bacterium]|nr:FlgD immunoglobulin-like domain containing protein [Chitinivibrionales bacterium]